ncbi:hypothetical protein ONE63_009074 [Megalurothrips usitatus]|nr:hypothetical protein ONE63_009074 [Megalurothrips usitatus]
MLAFDRNLFNRMTFNVNLCCDADDLRRHIEWGGGCVSSINEEGPYTITLVNSRASVSHAKWAKDLFLSSFIFKCSTDNKLHSLKTFWIKSGRFNNDFQPDDILLQKLTWHEAVKEFSVVQSPNDIQVISSLPLLIATKGRYPVVTLEKCDLPAEITDDPPPNITKNRKRSRHDYSEQERQEMVAAIVENNWYGMLNNRQMWLQMEEKFPRHTWQSLMNHFKRRIMPFISDYNLSPRIIRKIRSQMPRRKNRKSSPQSPESSDEEPIKSKKFRKRSFMKPKKRDEEASDSSSSVQFRKLCPQRVQRQINSQHQEEILWSGSHDDQTSEQESEVLENNAVSYEWLEDQSISQNITERGLSTVSEKDKLIGKLKGGTGGSVSFESSCPKQSHSIFPVRQRATQNNPLTGDLNFEARHKCSQPSLLNSVPLGDPEGSVQEEGVTENCESSGALSYVEGEESDEAETVTQSEWSDDGVYFRGLVADMSCASPADASLPFPENSEVGNAKNSTESLSLVYMFARRENSKGISEKNVDVQCDHIPTNDASVQTDPVILGPESSSDEPEETPSAITSTSQQPPESQSLPLCFAKQNEFFEKESPNESFSVEQDTLESSGSRFVSGCTEVTQPTPSSSSLTEEENVSASPSRFREEILVDVDQFQDVTTSPHKKDEVLPETNPLRSTPSDVNIANQRMTRNRVKQEKRQTRSTAKHILRL